MKDLFEKKLSEVTCIINKPEYKPVFDKLNYFFEFNKKIEIDDLKNMNHDEYIINKTKLNMLAKQGEYLEDLSGMELKVEDMKTKSELKTIKNWRI